MKSSNMSWGWRMPQIDLPQIFLESAGEVLETMFFTAVESESTGESAPAEVSAELRFQGMRSGEFGVQMPLETARQIASNFLGLEELADQQVEQVVCELCNMLCGSVLSRLAAEARFDLQHPKMDASNISWRERSDAVGYTFSLGEGSLTIWITLREWTSAVLPSRQSFSEALQLGRN